MVKHRFPLAVASCVSSVVLLAHCVGDTPIVPSDGGPDVITDSPAAETSSDAAPPADSGVVDTGVDAGPEPVGLVDNTYTNGVVTTSPVPMNYAAALAVDSQGRAYISGNAYNCVTASSNYDFMVIRLTTTGAIDSSFGTNGYRCVDFETSTNDSSMANAVAVDGSGNVFLGGYSYGSGGGGAAVAKLDSSGTLVWRWRNPNADAGTPPVASAIGLVVSGARVYALGSNGLNIASRTQSFIVALQANNGALDTAFDNTGIFVDTTAYAYFNGAPGASTLYAAGGTPGANRKFYVRRFTSQGVYDTTFGASSGAIATQTSASGNDTAISVAIQSDGKVLAAGPSGSKGTNANFSQAVVVRYVADGTALDPSFASGSGKPGVYFSNLEWLDNDNGEVGGLVLEPSGMMVLGGSLSLASDGGLPRDLALTHLKSDGTLDTTFGQGGVARANYSGGGNFLQVVRDPQSGKYVVLGFDGNPVVYRFD